MRPSQQPEIQPDIDAWHMARSLDLAVLGRGRVEPNPMVGCVIAQGAEIIGEGYHRKFGVPHAEVEALAVAGKRAAGATAYVTLEPCCHQGKTPPCTDALLASGIARVVYAMHDPFPKVAGGGAALLRQACIAVEIGLFESSAQRLVAIGILDRNFERCQPVFGNPAHRDGHALPLSAQAARGASYAGERSSRRRRGGPAQRGAKPIFCILFIANICRLL